MITKVTSTKTKTQSTQGAVAGMADGHLAAEFSRLLDSLKTEVKQQRRADMPLPELPVEPTEKKEKEPARDAKAETQSAKDFMVPLQVPVRPEPIKQKGPEAREGEREAPIGDNSARKSAPEVVTPVKEQQPQTAEEFTALQDLKAILPQQQTQGTEVVAPEAEPEPEVALPESTPPPVLAEANPAAPQVSKGVEVPQGMEKTAPQELSKEASQAIGEVPAEASVEGAGVSAPEGESEEIMPGAPRETREQAPQKAPLMQGESPVNAVATAAAGAVATEKGGVSVAAAAVKASAVNSVEGVNRTSSNNGGPVGGSFVKTAGEAQGTTTKAPKELSRTHSLRALEMVESALKEASRSKDGKSISFRLDPPQLGQIKVDVSLRDGALHARIVAESPEVNQMLREKGHELQGMLRGLGLNVDKVSVSITSDGQQLWSEQRSGQQQQEKQGPEQDILKELMFVDSKSQARAVKLEQRRQEVPLDHWVA